jgi:hypothetical protein
MVTPEGVALFRLPLPPGAHRELTFTYALTAASSVQGL